jgi:transposase
VKRRYKSFLLEAIDRAKLAESVRDKRVVFGVDVAKECLLGAVRVLGSQEVLATIRWRAPHQMRALVELLKQLPVQSLEVAMEPSGTYGDALRGLLHAAGIPVFRVSPKRCHDAAEVYDGVPSQHDAKDAAIIAKLHIDGASQVWRQPTERERELGAAVDTMSLYDEQYLRALNRIEAKLARYWPELGEELTLDSKTLLELLVSFTSPAEVAARSDEAVRLMGRVARRMIDGEKRERIVEQARHSIGVAMTEPERRSFAELAREALRLREAAHRAKAEVERLVLQHDDIERMAAAVGKATAAVLVVSVGEPASYSSSGAYLKSYGLNLKERSSGKHKGQLKISKRGPGRARRYLYMAVLRLVQTDALFAAWYARKVVRDGGKVKVKAIVALMRKLVRALWHVGRGAPFDTTKLFDRHKLELEVARAALAS